MSAPREKGLDSEPHRHWGETALAISGPSCCPGTAQPSLRLGQGCRSSCVQCPFRQPRSQASLAVPMTVSEGTCLSPSDSRPPASCTLWVGPPWPVLHSWGTGRKKGHSPSPCPGVGPTRAAASHSPLWTVGGPGQSTPLPRPGLSPPTTTCDQPLALHVSL